MSFALPEFSVLSSCSHVRFWVLDDPEHEQRSEKREA